MRRIALAVSFLAACGGTATSSSSSSTSSGAGGVATGAGGNSGAGGNGTTATSAGTGGNATTTTTTAGSGGQGGASTTTGAGGAGGQGGASTTTSTTTGAGGSPPMPCGGSCPAGYVCGSANGLEVCRAPSGIPLFSSVTVIVMENTTLSTLQAAMNANAAPNLKSMAATYATGSNYHGVAHPSLPNYIALTSGDTQGISCDCKAQQNQGSCNIVTCNLLLGTCSCSKPATSIADQLETAQLSWRAFGEAMGAPCKLTDAGTYAVRHIPFLYYDGIQGDAARCNAHVLDLAAFDPSAPSKFNFIAPDLVHDMHDPFPAFQQNITNGDTWIGPEVATITGAAAFQKGGLLVVVWDEDDASGGIGGSDDPIEIIVISPYAKSGGYVSAPKANHYSLLATFEDGLGLPRLGNAGAAHPGIADTLADYFPAN